ncbi:hypothetical protein FNV43_RR02551 [Rhamnella rubrinervis]|uniref:Ubiquitin-like protease family profile domain-containing protein n=1 Tax=Rhamnella rubrinervis TaxID=2594499 RepID=A0A8K0HRP3_9ROSA|nr:hypothetical protein FNV43_RR02551 [Rhamnella rubrinervis]
MVGKNNPNFVFGRCIKKSAILKSPFTQLPNSGPPREKEPLQVMFDSFQPIPPVDRNALMTFLEDSNRVDHDCIYERLGKPSLQNIINSGDWLRDNSWMWVTYDAITKINIHTHPNKRPPVPKHDWTVDIDATLIKYVKRILLAHSSSWNKIDHNLHPSVHNSQPFSISRQRSDCPQQTVSGDCGVVMLKCIEYLSSSKNFDYGQDNI